jgi:hypothetical protein
LRGSRPANGATRNVRLRPIADIRLKCDVTKRSRARGEAGEAQAGTKAAMKWSLLPLAFMAVGYIVLVVGWGWVLRQDLADDEGGPVEKPDI